MQKGNIEIYFATMQCLKYLIDNTVANYTSVEQIKIKPCIPIQQQSFEKKTAENVTIAPLKPLKNQIKCKCKLL